MKLQQNNLLVITDVKLYSITHTVNPTSYKCSLDHHFNIKYATIKTITQTITVLCISKQHEA